MRRVRSVSLMGSEVGDVHLLAVNPGLRPSDVTHALLFTLFEHDRSTHCVLLLAYVQYGAPLCVWCMCFRGRLVREGLLRSPVASLARLCADSLLNCCSSLQSILIPLSSFPRVSVVIVRLLGCVGDVAVEPSTST